MTLLKALLPAIFAVLASAGCFHEGYRYDGLQESLRASKAALSICEHLCKREIDDREPVGFCRDTGPDSQIDVIVEHLGPGKKKVPVHECYESVTALTLKCAQGGAEHKKDFIFM